MIEPVLSYIDPNTGGVLFTWLVTSLALISGAFLLLAGRIRAYFARMRRFFRERTALRHETPPGASESTQEDEAGHSE